MYRPKVRFYVREKKESFQCGRVYCTLWLSQALCYAYLACMLARYFWIFLNALLFPSLILFLFRFRFFIFIIFGIIDIVSLNHVFLLSSFAIVSCFIHCYLHSHMYTWYALHLWLIYNTFHRQLFWSHDFFVEIDREA